jgi:hypothetical protein
MARETAGSVIEFLTITDHYRPGLLVISETHGIFISVRCASRRYTGGDYRLCARETASSRWKIAFDLGI